MHACMVIIILLYWLIFDVRGQSAKMMLLEIILEIIGRRLRTCMYKLFTQGIVCHTCMCTTIQ